mmetsp:Transcript_5583/g.8809  ORF Transcript_5583/g.8809 Transcript_5583/m.8809 type:complete len:123 (+) Transcript_5583:1386-1754(+)
MLASCGGPIDSQYQMSGITLVSSLAKANKKKERRKKNKSKATMRKEYTAHSEQSSVVSIASSSSGRSRKRDFDDAFTDDVDQPPDLVKESLASFYIAQKKKTEMEAKKNSGRKTKCRDRANV